MLLAIANVAMRGPLSAALLVSSSLLLGLVMFPAIWLSGAVLALVVLRKGLTSGLQVLGLSTVLVMAGSWFFLQTPLGLLPLVISVWGPVLAVAVCLRLSVSLSLSMQLAGGIGLLAVLVFSLVVDNPTEFWQTLLRQVFSKERLTADFPGQPQFVAEIQASLDVMARLLTGTLGMLLVLNAALSMFWARWWQAALYNPGGFQPEFLGLSLGRVWGVLAVVGILVSVTSATDMALHLAIVLVGLFLFQGLAVVHGVVKHRGLHRAWLIGLYSLILLPQVSFGLAVLGIADTWFNFRKSWQSVNN